MPAPATAERSTLCERFQRAVEHHGPQDAQRWKQDDEWRSRTYAQLGRAVEEVALGLMSLEIEEGDRVGIVGHNTPGWAIADWSILHAGGVSVPAYPQLKPEQLAYILDDAGVELCFVGDEELYEKVQTAAKDAPSLTTIVRLDDGGKGPLHGAAARNVDRVFPLRNLIEEGQKIAGSSSGQQRFAERWRGIEPDDIATFIYTSGTTGAPKGVMLSHGNIDANIRSFTSSIELHAGERFLSFLPLSHSYERVVGHFAGYGAGMEIWYAQAIETIGEDLKACRPNLIIAVPRLWEKMGDRIRAALDEATGVKRRLIDWATRIGEDVLEHRMEHGEEPGGLLGLKFRIAENLVLEKVRGEAGLDQLRLANSGAAALDPEVARFFWSLGIEIYEGYGMTETSPVLTANRPDAFKLGTVGKAIPGVQLRIDDEEWEGPEGEGEILAKGLNVMQGYWQLPEETDEALEDGWMHTGDVGQLDEEGFLTITDRKKELFKTAYGKYIAPEHVSQEIKRAGDVVDQVLVVGESRKYVAALLTPDFEALEHVAKEEGIEFRDPAELLEHEAIERRFEDAVEEANEVLARHEQVKTFRVLPDQWEVGEEMTPTLKIKRRVVEERYADVIEEMYPDE